MLGKLSVTAASITLLAALVSQAAVAETITFDSIPAGSPATDAAPPGTEFLPAIYDYLYDSYGDPIAGSLAWRVDPDQPTDSVRVGNPVNAGFIAAPSPSNALDGRFQPTLMVFGADIALAFYSLAAITFDNTTFGGTPVADASLQFLDQSGQLLGTAAFVSNGSGFTASLAGPLAGVRQVLLSSGAFYDNIEYAPIPLPGAVWLLGSALMGLWFGKRRAIA